MPEKKSLVYCQFSLGMTEDSCGEIDRETFWMDEKYFGHPLNKKDMGDIYRYLSFVFGSDEIDKKKLVKSFKSALDKIEEYFTDILTSRDSTVNVYGVIQANKCEFEPTHYEFDQNVRIRRTGTIWKSKDEDKINFQQDKHYLGTITMSGKLCVFNDKRLDDEDNFKRGIIKGKYSGRMNVFLIEDEKRPNKGGTLCLVDDMHDLCGVHWTRINDFFEAGVKYVGICDLNNKDKIQASIDKLSKNKLLDIDFNDRSGLIVARVHEHSDKPSETWMTPYVAYDKDPNGNQYLVGVAVDTQGNQAATLNALMKYLTNENLKQK